MLAVHLETVVLPAAANPHTNGFAAYYTASRVLLEQPGDLAPIYDDKWFQSKIDHLGFHHVEDVIFFQTPTMALLMAPVAWMPLAVARAVWIALAVAFWLAGSIIIGRAIVRRPLGIRACLGLAAAMTAYTPLRENLRQGQSYALLFFLLAAYVRLQLGKEARDSWAAGVPLGCMMVVKLGGAWLWPLLLFSRQWRTVTAAAVTSLAIAFVSLPWTGGHAWGVFFHELPRLASEPVRYVTAYQTVTSLLGHLLVYDPILNRHPVAHWPVVARVSTITVIVLAIVQSLRYADWGKTLAVDSRSARALSLAMFGALIVTLGPVAEGYHYVLLLPTVMIAWWWGALDADTSIASWVMLVTGTLLLVVPQKLYGSAAIQVGWLALLAYPRVYGAFVLWIWLGRQLKKHSSIARRGASAGQQNDHEEPDEGLSRQRLLLTGHVEEGHWRWAARQLDLDLVCELLVALLREGVLAGQLSHEVRHLEIPGHGVARPASAGAGDVAAIGLELGADKPFGLAFPAPGTRRGDGHGVILGLLLGVDKVLPEAPELILDLDRGLDLRGLSRSRHRRALAGPITREHLEGIVLRGWLARGRGAPAPPPERCL
jgi:hypothetical protein